MLEEAGHRSVVSLLGLGETRLVDTVAHLVVHPPVHLLGERFFLVGLGGEIQLGVADSLHAVEPGIQHLDDLRRLVVDDRLGLLARNGQNKTTGRRRPSSPAKAREYSE